MDVFTTLVAGLMVLTILSVFLACIPVFIIISMMLNHSQARMADMMQQNQEWTINAIATLSDHHSDQLQQICLNLFGEMKRLSGKIPAVPVPPSKQTTSPMKKLPTPSPILMTTTHDEENSPLPDDD